MRHVQTRTDFSQFSHQQLIGMLAASDPATIRAAAARWDSTGRLLQDQAAALQQKLAGFQDKWQGKAAEQYQQMITELANGLRTVGNTAWAVRDASFDAADALDTARAQMPAPVAVPEVPPATVAMASAPPQLDGLTQPQTSQVIQQQTAAAVAVQNQQQAQTAADGAHAQAVQVMTTLADHYAADDAAIPDVPDAGVAPQANPTGPGSSSVSPTLTSPSTIGSGVAPGDVSGIGTGVANDIPGGPTADPAVAVPGSPADLTRAAAHNPLFGTMFASGIAAAGGAFPLARVPTLVRRRDRNSAGSDPNAASTAAAAGAAAAATKIAGAGGMSGAGAGGGVGGGGGPAVSAASAAPAPSGYAGLAGASGAGGAGSMAGLAGPVGGAAGSAASSGGFMGGMPMGAGMGGMGMDGGGRRIPPWLVETEDVWGESSAVAPTVIGEEL